MADINSPKATAFTNQAREVATQYENLYWMMKQLTRQWYSLQMDDEIPNTSDSVVDGNQARPLTGEDVTNIVAQCDAAITTAEATNNAILNIFLKGSNLSVED